MLRAGIVLIGLAVALSTAVSAQQTGRKITGEVVDAKRGNPVANVHVRYVESGSRATQTTTTDAKGRFELPGGVRGVVTVTAQQYATARRAWPSRSGRLGLQFWLHPPARIEGTLVDSATGAAADGYVMVYVRDPINGANTSARARRGVFRLDGLLPGPAVVLAHAQGFAPYFGTLTVNAGEARTTRIGLLLEAAVSGWVVDGNDDPIEGARVRIGYDRTLPGRGFFASAARGRATTRSEGEFELRGLLPDTPIAVQAELDGRRSDVVTISVAPGMAQRGIVLRLP